MKRNQRYDALQNGEPFYFSNKPCKRGHLTLRRATTGTCIECAKIMAVKRYHADPQKTKERVKKIYWSNPEKYRQKVAQYRASFNEAQKKDFLETSKLRSRKWRKTNPNHFWTKVIKQTFVMNRRAKALNRMPKWLTETDLWIFEQAQEIRLLRQELFGFKWDVHHILPLRGELVSGLHTPFNLEVIPRSEHLKKHRFLKLTGGLSNAWTI